MDDVCIVMPQMKDGWMKHEFSSREALGVQYIVSSLRNNDISCRLINAHAYFLENEEICEIILSENIKIVGISCLSQRSYPHTKELIKMLRSQYNYDGIIFIGGFFATLAYEEIFKDIGALFDFLIRGEGEEVLPKIIQKLKYNFDIEEIEDILYYKNNKINGDVNHTHYIENLDSISFPIRDIDLFNGVIESEKNFKIISGRGCYNNCTFCSIINDERPRKKRYRTPKNIIEEIEILLNNYNINHFRFCDEIFYTNSKYGKQWVADFVDIIKEKDLKFTFHIEMRAVDITREELSKLKEVGLKCVSVGYESGSQRILDEMKKNCTIEDNLRSALILKELDIDNAISFITLVPTMSFEELKINYEFLKKIGGYSAHNLYNKLNLYVGCEYEEILKEKGLLLPKENFYERSNFKYADLKVQIYSNLIESMKLKVLKCRKFVLYVSEMNFVAEKKELEDKFVSYFNNLFKEFTLEFVDFCMIGLENNILNEEYYLEFIENEVKSIINKLVEFCEENSLNYNLNLDNFNADYIFI